MTPAAPTPDRGARHRIRTALGENLLVEASAGTGKTSELVRRVVAVLQHTPTTVDRIAAVTFTHKAAGEMKLRLRQGLDRARSQPDLPAIERARLEHALEHLEEASIGTIHSFCAQILRERPIEARIDPAFEEIPEDEASRVWDRAFRQWFERKLDAAAPGLRRALARLAWPESDFDKRSPLEALSASARALVEWRDHDAPWERRPFDRDAEVDALLIELEALTQSAALHHAHELHTSLRRAEQVRPRDYDACEARLIRLLRPLRDSKNPAAIALTAHLESFRARANAELAALLRDEMWELVEDYQSRKRRAGQLDFTDLLLLVRDLLRQNAAVRAWLQRRFERIFVDEFQDTDPIQVEILLLLAADDESVDDWRRAAPAPGKLFLVGDPKQSIYKFRRADMVLYREVRDLLARRGVAVVELTRSFRSVRPIQECVNAGFEPEMTGDAVSGQAPYAPLHEYAAPIPNQPAIVALPAPSPYSPKTRKITKGAVKECMPDAVAAFLEWLLTESGWKVRDPARPNTLTPVAARHVCVLFRRMLNYGEDVTRAYVHALENRGLTHLLAGSKSFHQREEVETMRNVLTAIEWPDDELSVYATLRGSLFSFPDAVLLRFRHAAGHLHPFRPLPDGLDEELAPVAEALQLLQTWHRERNRRPAASTVSAVLEAARAHAGFAFRPAGNQVLANVYRVAGLARRFEAGGGLSFRGFVEMLAAEAELRESAEAPVLEEGADGVRLMTVHAAKGLEFPVVVLADPTVNIRAPNPERYLDAPRRLCALRLLRFAPYELIEHEQLEQDREHAEGVRVAYVAATRARDLLVVPAVAEKPMDGWLAPLNRALYPPADTWSAAGRVPPGRHRPQEGTHEVVWWDLKTLRLGVEADFSLRQQEVLAPTEPGASEGRARYDEWAARRAATLAAGAAPSRLIFTPTEVSEPPPGFAVEVEVEAVPRAAGRPAGKRFGALVHALLSVVDYTAAPDQVQVMAATEARLFGATVEERDAAAEAVSRALEHPVLQAARRAANIYREAPILAPVEDGRTLEGVVDLLFEENGVWRVVDFKTDSAPDDVARYRAQLAWYAYAVVRLTGAQVRCTLLAV